MNFQDIVIALQKFWVDNGCTIIHPIDTEVGAATFHYATMLYALGTKPSNIVYIQSCRRPIDGRFAKNPNRIQCYYQLQVLLKPSPKKIQQMAVNSIKQIGITSNLHDIRFIHSDWENPTLGAFGMGWEIWCNGMEVMQFTYMQRLGGVLCKVISGEITYGLERLAMFSQNKNDIWDLIWDKQGITYRAIHEEKEKEYCKYNFQYANAGILKQHFNDYEVMSKELLKNNLFHPSYDYCLKASHIFNILDAHGSIGITERACYINRVKNLVNECCMKYSQFIKK